MPATASPLVIVVDDDPQTLDLTSRYLGRRSFRTKVRDNPFGATNLIAEERPDAIVLDVNMPAIRGDQLARLLQSVVPDVPIIFYSSIDQFDGDRLASRFDNTTFVPKASGVRKLAETIQRLLA